MNTTTEKCFGSDFALMDWQEFNCMRCKKAVWYNQRLHRMPQYRCAVQEQIEGQFSGERMEINTRTFDATREKRCQFFCNKSQHEGVMNFARGESLVKAQPKEEAKEEAKVEQPTLTTTKEEEKPMAPKHNAAPLIKTAVLDSGLMKLAQESGLNYEDLKAAEQKMLHTKVVNGVTVPDLAQSRFKEKIHKETTDMLKTFTWQENMMIAFVPLVIMHIAWVYAEKARTGFATQKVSVTAKLSRALKFARQEYLNSLEKDLDWRHLRRIEEQSDRFLTEYGTDFAIFFYTVKAEYIKEYPDSFLATERTNAFISLLLCRFCEEHNNRMDKVIEKKLGYSAHLKNPFVTKMEEIMDAYFSPCEIKDMSKIDMCLRIFERNINGIEFVVDDSEQR